MFTAINAPSPSLKQPQSSSFTTQSTAISDHDAGSAEDTEMDDVSSQTDLSEHEGQLKEPKPVNPQPGQPTRDIVLDKAIGIGSERSILRLRKSARVQKPTSKCKDRLARKELQEKLFAKIMRCKPMQNFLQKKWRAKMGSVTTSSEGSAAEAGGSSVAGE